MEVFGRGKNGGPSRQRQESNMVVKSRRTVYYQRYVSKLPVEENEVIKMEVEAVGGRGR